MSSSLHDRVLDVLGARIISGEWAPGDIIQSEQLADELDVSRGVIREVTRVLQSLGLVLTVKRLGIRALPPQSWRLLDPAIIRWRLATAQKGAQLRSMSEFRAAIEPSAAALAAQYASDALGADLVALAAQMRRVGRAGDLAGFLQLDIRFHELILEASGNEMYAQLRDLIGEVLRGRTEYGLMPDHPHEEALAWHSDVASAILDRRVEDARAAMTHIMTRTIAEVEPVWRDTPRGLPRP